MEDVGRVMENSVKLDRHQPTQMAWNCVLVGAFPVAILSLPFSLYPSHSLSLYPSLSLRLRETII